MSCRLLQDADPLKCETTLLIHPQVLTDFRHYNDFLDECDAAVTQLGLDGELQVASFHPSYQFAGTRAEDIENYTNRSPYPMLAPVARSKRCPRRGELHFGRRRRGRRDRRQEHRDFAPPRPRRLAAAMESGKSHAFFRTSRKGLGHFRQENMTHESTCRTSRTTGRSHHR